MVTLANKQVYIALNTVNVSDRWVSLTLTESAALIDVTGGVNAGAVERAPGLSRARLEIKLRYDTATLPDYAAHMRPGTPVNLVYGAEGAAAGKPSVSGAFLVAQVSHTRAANKAAVLFDLVLESAGAMTTGVF